MKKKSSTWRKSPLEKYISSVGAVSIIFINFFLFLQRKYICCQSYSNLEIQSMITYSRNNVLTIGDFLFSNINNTNSEKKYSAKSSPCDTS